MGTQESTWPPTPEGVMSESRRKGEDGRRAKGASGRHAKSGSDSGDRRDSTPTPAETEFDDWLRAGLRRLYDPILSEPLPEDIVALIRSHKQKRNG
jgi:hypothetical protein